VTREQAGAWLRHLGLTDTDGKSGLIARASAALGSDGGAGTVRGLYVPGRIEVFGKHTDYAGGHTLICAPSRGFCAAFRVRHDAVTRVQDLASGPACEFRVDGALDTDLPGWPRYPATVIRRLATNFPGRLRGIDLAFASDLPRAAGMSSSSALMVTVLLALVEAAGLREDPAWQTAITGPVDVAGYAGCVENGADFGPLRGDAGVGTSGGSEDHMAMLCAEAASLSLCAFVPARLQRRVAVHPDVVFAIGVSGVAAEKTGAAREAYNAASRRARSLLELWRADTRDEAPSLAAVLAQGPPALAHLRALAVSADARGGERLTARLDQFALESTHLVPAAAEAFDSANWPRVGELAAESHRAADEWLGNQIAETNMLARLARESGALAASPFGAGFGGSVWALVPRVDAAATIGGWEQRYRSACPHVQGPVAFFATDAGPHAAVR
jgi:galactokinase